MIRIQLMKNGERLSSQLGAPVRKTVGTVADKAMAYKQQVFNRLHRANIVSFDYSEFLCGNCRLRDSYLNKLTSDRFTSEADYIRGIL